MARIKINKDKCKGCMLCVSFCPRGLIIRARNLNKKGIHCVEYKIRKDKSTLVRRSTSALKFSSGEGGCTGCGMCAIMCPEACIEVYK